MRDTTTITIIIIIIVVMVDDDAEQVVAQSAARIMITTIFDLNLGVEQAGGVVLERATALRALREAHAVAGVGDSEDTVSEEEPDAEGGGCEAEGGPFGGQGHGSFGEVVAMVVGRRLMEVGALVVVGGVFFTRVSGVAGVFFTLGNL